MSEQQEWVRLKRLALEGKVKLPKRLPTEKWLEEFWCMPRPSDPEGSVRKAVIEDRSE